MLTILKTTYLGSSRKFHRIILGFLAASVVFSYVADLGTDLKTMIFYLILTIACFVFDLSMQNIVKGQNTIPVFMSIRYSYFWAE